MNNHALYRVFNALNKVVRNQKVRVFTMKLLKINKDKIKKPSVIKPATPKKERKTHKNTLPPDKYEDEFDPIEVPVDDSRKLILSVRRGGEFGLPNAIIDARQYQTTEVYEGFTKKGFNIPVELLPDLIEGLEKVRKECIKHKLL